MSQLTYIHAGRLNGTHKPGTLERRAFIDPLTVLDDDEDECQSIEDELFHGAQIDGHQIVAVIFHPVQHSEDSHQRGHRPAVVLLDELLARVLQIHHLQSDQETLGLALHKVADLEEHERAHKLEQTVDYLLESYEKVR